MGKAWEMVICPSESSSRVPKMAPIRRPVQSSLRLWNWSKIECITDGWIWTDLTPLTEVKVEVEVVVMM